MKDYVLGFYPKDQPLQRNSDYSFCYWRIQFHMLLSYQAEIWCTVFHRDEFDWNRFCP